MAGETYTKRYPGGFVNRPNVSTPIDSAFLNGVETALGRLLGEDPAADEVGVWVPASNRFVFKKITNAEVDAAAAIALSKLAGYPADATKFARGDGTWAVPPGASTVATIVSLNAAQSIPNNTQTEVVFQNEDDPGNFYNPATGRFTAPTTGLYRLEGKIWLPANGTGSRHVSVRRNGDTTKRLDEYRHAAWAGDWNILPFNALMRLTAGDYVSVWVFQDSGGALNATGPSTAANPGDGSHAYFEQVG